MSLKGVVSTSGLVGNVPLNTSKSEINVGDFGICQCLYAFCLYSLYGD